MADVRMTTQAAVRKSFWNNNRQFLHLKRSGWTQNDYPTDVRVSFVDYVDTLAKDGDITQELAQRVTL